TLIGSSPNASFTVNGTGAFVDLSSITGSTSPPGTLDLAQTIVLSLTSSLSSFLHVAVEVTGLSSPYVTGNLTFTSGFANSGITGNLNVTETTNLGSLCSGISGGVCTGFGTFSQLGTTTFVGPQLSGNSSAFANAVTGASYTVFDEFDFIGGA